MFKVGKRPVAPWTRAEVTHASSQGEVASEVAGRRAIESTVEVCDMLVYGDVFMRSVAETPTASEARLRDEADSNRTGGEVSTPAIASRRC